MAIKRKAITRDSPKADEVVLSDGGNGVSNLAVNGLDGPLSESEGEDALVGDNDEAEDDEEDEEGWSEGDGSDFWDEADDSDASMGSRLSESSLPREGVKPIAIIKDANGNPRYLYEDIDPNYPSDDSDAPETKNTIGDIPLSFYDSYPHIGYDVQGHKISRPAKGDALDQLLDSIEIPEGFTGLIDPATGKPLELTKEELDIIKRIQQNEVPEEQYDPYAPTIEYFTSKLETMPLSAAPEPKRRFVPSKHEAKRVMKLVKAIREGRIKPYKEPKEEDEEDQAVPYDLWTDETPRPDHAMHMPAPKLPPPGFELSYHPPPEYLPDEEEKKAWEEADPEDRERDYLPTDHDSLRKVPGYGPFTKELFERSLDLYLAPRTRRVKISMDPESLLPKLPSPEGLRPFPSACALVFRGHDGMVRSAQLDPSGLYLATGGNDGTVRIWEGTGSYQLCRIKLTADKDDAVDAVRWRPGKDGLILAAAVGEAIYLIVPTFSSPQMEAQSKGLIDAGWGYATQNGTNSTSQKDSPAQWARPSTSLIEKGVLVKISLRSTIKVLTWHRRGDYFASVSPRGQSSAVAIHSLSKHHTQLPFRRLRNSPQTAQFHPSKPLFFVATQQKVRCYDLQKQILERIEQPGARWISSLDIHPGGNNMIVGSYDKRLLWHDLELSSKPYKTLRYHKKAIRAVKFHSGALPLFADASDDGTLQIFHGKVVGDAMENAAIVPLKVLRGHSTGTFGVLGVDWHPVHPWIVSAGADGTCRLWT